MKIFPAIDIISGRCVRLTQGDYNKEKKYDLTPLEAALKYKELGSKYLHVVDLDAALQGSSKNYEVISQLAKKTDMFIQVGGGIRNLDIIDKYINQGISRVILGTNAIKNKNFLKDALNKFPNHVALSLDVLDDFIYTDGWTIKTDMTIYNFLDDIELDLLSAVIVTDISKDGMMQGANLKLMQKLNNHYSINLIASGGVCTMQDIKKLKEMDLYGAIIGKALYEKTLSLKQVLAYVES